MFMGYFIRVFSVALSFVSVIMHTRAHVHTHFVACVSTVRPLFSFPLNEVF